MNIISSPIKIEKYGRIVLLLIFVFAIGIRLVGIFHDLPFSFFGDELHLMKRAMAIGSGDLNPHWFHKPAFLMYILTFCYGILFVIGWLLGQFSTAYEYGAYFLQDKGLFLLIGRSVIAAFGVATVYVVYRITMRVTNNQLASLISTCTAAVLVPMVLGSIVVKADVPAGFFVILSVYFFMANESSKSFKPLVFASLLAGLAMGTKYFGIVLLPGFMLAQIVQKFTFDRSWFETGYRMLMIGLLFIVGFFAVSPYNFLDPLWGRGLFETVTSMISQNTGETLYDPDKQITFEAGRGSIPGAIGFLVSRLVQPNFLGWSLTVLAIGGIVSLLLEKKYAYLLYLIIPLGFYCVIAAVAAPYHVSARHLNGIYPLICVLIGPGVLCIARSMRLGSKWLLPAIIIITGIAIIPTGLSAVQRTWDKLLPDSRVEAYNWIIRNIPENSEILLDDYGPVLQPNKMTALRYLEDLENFPEKDAFTIHQKKRLELISEFPPQHGFDLYELGHQWWLSSEITDEELRSSEKHRDMSNPLISREPKRVSDYLKKGIRFIVTNSEAQNYYDPKDPRGSQFPSFIEFYDDLKQYEPIYSIDPKDREGKGPAIFIYDISKN